MSEREPEVAGVGVDVFVHLPVPLYRRLRLAANVEQLTLAQLVRVALDHYLPGEGVR